MTESLAAIKARLAPNSNYWKARRDEFSSWQPIVRPIDVPNSRALLADMIADIKADEPGRATLRCFTFYGYRNALTKY